MQPPEATTGTVVRIFFKDMLVVLFFLLFAEILLRAFMPQPLQVCLRNVYTIKDRNQVRYKPGVKTVCSIGFEKHPFEINTWGCRDRNYGPKSENEWRILCVGDSFSVNQALAVQEIYPNVLEKMLGKQYPDRKFQLQHYNVP